MQDNLKEFHDFIQQAFPKVKSPSIYKILFSIQARIKNFEEIGLSRYEYDKFQVSERTLRGIIELLRDYGILEYSQTIISTNQKRIINRDYQKCYTYTVSNEFKEMFLSFERFCKNVFEYINPIEFMKKYLRYTEKNSFYFFKIA
jgi:hypothetical protein